MIDAYNMNMKKLNMSSEDDMINNIEDVIYVKFDTDEDIHTFCEIAEKTGYDYFTVFTIFRANMPYVLFRGAFMPYDMFISYINELEYLFGI